MGMIGLQLSLIPFSTKITAVLTSMFLSRRLRRRLKLNNARLSTKMTLRTGSEESMVDKSLMTVKMVTILLTGQEALIDGLTDRKRLADGMIGSTSLKSACVTQVDATQIREEGPEGTTKPSSIINTTN